MDKFKKILPLFTTYYHFVNKFFTLKEKINTLNIKELPLKITKTTIFQYESVIIKKIGFRIKKLKRFKSY